MSVHGTHVPMISPDGCIMIGNDGLKTSSKNLAVHKAVIGFSFFAYLSQLQILYWWS